MTLALLLALALVPASANAAPLDNRDPRDDIFYQIMPIAWRDSTNDANRFGDFLGMTAGMPYLKSLGVTALWMTPIFPSPAYHGYQHGSPDSLDTSRYGSEAQFFSFVNRAHSDSVKVFIDLVAYGVSQSSKYFTTSYLNHASPYTPYLAYTNGTNSTYDGGTYNSWNGAAVGFIRWNNDNPGATSVVTNGCKHWLDPNNDGNPADGIDGFRLDHVLLSDTHGYNIAWWQTWKAALRTKNPSVFTFAEQADWGSHGGELLTAHDACFTKPFEFAARTALATETAAGLYSEMRSTIASLPAGKLYLCTIGDHDVDRLMSSIGNDMGRAKSAAAVLMTQPYPPIVYFGDELGMTGTKQNYGSDANDIPMREPFKWKAVAGAPMTNYFMLNSGAYNNRFERDNDGRSVQEQSGVAGSLLETYKTLIAYRKTHIALRRGTYAEIPNSSAATWAFARQAAGSETLLVAINLSNAALNVALDMSNFAVTGGRSKVRDVVSQALLADLTTANRNAYVVSIPAHGYRILNAGVDPLPPPVNTMNGIDIINDEGASALVATQAVPTAQGDNNVELDQMYVKPVPGGLRVGITGNIPTDGSAIALFVDAVAGGQDTLRTSTVPAPPNGVSQLDGLVMDSGFVPEQLFWINGYNRNVYVNAYSLPKGSVPAGRYVGATSMSSGNGDLSGGTNANGMQVAFDDSNTVGITAASVANAGTATRGLEAYIPYVDLGLGGPGTSIKLMAVIVYTDGFLTNQFLPGLPTGTTSVGYAPVSLRNFAGNQYVTLPATLSAAPPTSAALRLASAPNPFRDTTMLRFTLPTAGSVRLDLLDASGRRVRVLGPAQLGAGTQSVTWDGRDESGRRVPPGIYLVRLTAGTDVRQAKVIRMR
jgi:glycosidase